MSAILFTTGKVSDTLPADWVSEHVDLRPAAIIGKLHLLQPHPFRYRCLWPFRAGGIFLEETGPGTY